MTMKPAALWIGGVRETVTLNLQGTFCPRTYNLVQLTNTSKSKRNHRQECVAKLGGELTRSTLERIELQSSIGGKMGLLSVTRKLETRSPVPSDIDIAQSVEPLPISQIAESLGLAEEDYELYGNKKAKVTHPHHYSDQHSFR